MVFSILTSCNTFSTKTDKEKQLLFLADEAIELNIVNSQSDIFTNMENIKKIIGRVQIYGNGPHTFVGIISNNDIEYAIYPPEYEEKLRELQGRLIEFYVILMDQAQSYGGVFLKGGTVKLIEWNILR